MIASVFHKKAECTCINCSRFLYSRTRRKTSSEL